jgi:hypothetical protein
MGSDGVYRWEFEKGDESLTISVNGPLIVGDLDVTIRATMNGLGLALSLEE